MLKSYKLPIIKPITWAVFIIIIFFSCATPVAPTGGEKDEIPPIVVEYKPQNYTVNFDRDKIEITFNEFVQLKEISQKLMISPPMDDKPEIDTKGKSVVIEIIDTLLPNTTYTFYFADAIVDLHESNPINNFEYVFSTGPVLDSMKISGRLVDAYTKKPVKDAFVMLYKEYADSVPIKKIPFYLSKTDGQGNFSLSNLAVMKYKLFALKDANSNYLFDLPNEKIAFSDTLITPFEISSKNMFKTLDTISADSVAADSLEMTQDSASLIAGQPRDSLILRFFKERDTMLKITTSTIERNKFLTLGFNKPVDSLSIKALKPKWENQWNIMEWFEEKDSVLVWLKDFSSDSLVIELNADSLLRDTLTFTYFEKEKRKNTAAKDPNNLEIKAILDGNNQLLRHPLEIEFNHPVLNSFNTDSLMLFSTEDTLKTGFEKYDLRKLRVKYPWKESMNYKLLIPDSIFTSIYGVGNDSTMISFRTKALKDYGTSIINIKTDSILTDTPNYFIQLLSQDEKELFSTFSTNKDTTVTFNLLEPGKYKLKGFVDNNNNHRWDSGLYLRHEQPEKVFYYKGVIEIIGNWEVEYDWKIKP